VMNNNVNFLEFTPLPIFFKAKVHFSPLKFEKFEKLRFLSPIYKNANFGP